MFSLVFCLMCATPGLAPKTCLAVWTPRNESHLVMASAKGIYGVRWWAEANGELLVLADCEALNGLGQLGFLHPIDLEPRLDRLYVVSNDLNDVTGSYLVLMKGARSSVVYSEQPVATKHPDSHGLLANVVDNVVLEKAPLPPFPLTHCSGIQALVDQIDGPRWFNDVQSLASFNRHTLQSGNIAARDWLVTQFQAIGGLTVTTEAFVVSGTTTYNVIAQLDGTTSPDDWYIVGAHYDSTSENTPASAPGAEDNGSGTAALLELARLLTTTTPESTIFFIAYSGEEQGLHGSTAHASGLVSSGNDSKVKVALIMDMIGYSSDADLDCLLETNASNQFIIDDLSAAAASYTSLRIVTTLFPFGSDHVPYLNRNMPALLTIENDWDEYPDYHRTTDLPANINLNMGREVIRMNAAALIEWTSAATCVDVQELLSLWHSPISAPTDTNGNGIVDVVDLLQHGIAN